MAKTKKLTVKQQRYIDSYNGNIKKSAKIAGISYIYAKELHSKAYYAHIMKAIRNREKGRRNSKIANRKERQEFWTDSMRDDSVNIRDRNKASELLGRSEADFTDKVKAEMELTVEIVNYGDK